MGRGICCRHRNNVNYLFLYFCFNNTEGLIPSEIVHGSIGSSLTPSHASKQVHWFVMVSCLHMTVLYCVCVCVHVLIPLPAPKPSVVVWKCFIYSAISFFYNHILYDLRKRNHKKLSVTFSHARTRTHAHRQKHINVPTQQDVTQRDKPTVTVKTWKFHGGKKKSGFDCSWLGLFRGDTQRKRNR